jgi:hypothetical protein
MVLKNTLRLPWFQILRRSIGTGDGARKLSWLRSLAAAVASAKLLVKETWACGPWKFCQGIGDVMRVAGVCWVDNGETQGNRVHVQSTNLGVRIELLPQQQKS